MLFLRTSSKFNNPSMKNSTAKLLIKYQARRSDRRSMSKKKTKSECWMALAKTDITGLFRFEDTSTHPFRVTRNNYLNLLEKEVLSCPEARRGFQDCGLFWYSVSYQVNFRIVSSVAIQQCGGPSKFLNPIEFCLFGFLAA